MCIRDRNRRPLRMAAAAAVDTFGSTKKGPLPNTPENNFTVDNSGREIFNVMKNPFNYSLDNTHSLFICLIRISFYLLPYSKCKHNLFGNKTIKNHYK